MSKPFRALFFLLVLVLLVIGTSPLWQRGLRHLTGQPAPGRQSVQKDGDLGLCVDHRPTQPDAPAIPGLGPRVMLFSSDCRWLVAGNENGSIQLLERESGKLVAEAAGHAMRIQHLLISPDEKLLFSSAQTQEDVMVWSLPELKRVGVVNTSRRGSSALAYDERSGVLVTGTSRDLHGWKIAFGGPGEAQFSEPAFSAQAKGQIQSLAFSPDARYLAAGLGGAVQLWSYEGGAKPALREAAAAAPADEAKYDWIVALAFSADGKAVVSGSRSKKIAVWQVPSLEPVRQAAGEPARWELYTDPGVFAARPPRGYTGSDRKSLDFPLQASAADRVYAASVGMLVSNPVAWRGGVQAAGNAGGVAFFDIFANRPGPVLTVPAETRAARGTMLNFAVLPSRSLLAIKRGFDILIIDLESLKLLKSVQILGGRAHLQWIASGKYLAYSNAEEVGYLTPETGELRQVPRPRWNGEQQLINLQLGASLDGSGVVAIFGDRLVQVDPDLRVKELGPVPLMAVQYVAPLPSKKAYLVAGPDGAQAFGNPEVKLALPARVDSGSFASLTPDGSTLYVKQPDAKLCRYSIDAPAACALVATAQNPGVKMSLDTDGKLLVEAGHTKKLRVLDAASGKELASLEGHLGEILYVKLLGSRVLSVDATGELRMWALENRQLLASARP